MKDFINNPFTLIHPGERPKPQSWRDFALTALLAVGTGLLLSGIIFFFAYNWADLHHFTKLGIIGTAIAALAIGACFCRKNHLAQQMLLLGASVMVGVLLAVFGQAYQLQSDSGFLAWALFIVLWVIVADFDPLWLIFVIVLQVGIFNTSKYNDRTDIMLILYVSFLCIIGLAALLPHLCKSIRERSKWLICTLFAMTAIYTIIPMVAYYDKWQNLAYLLSFVAAAGLYGLWKRHLSIISLGLLMILIDINIFTFSRYMFAGTVTCLASLAAYVWFIKWLKKEWNTPTLKNEEDGDSE